MREGECFAAPDFFAFVTPFVTLDLQSSVIFICGFVIQRDFCLRICNPQHPQMVSDCKSDSLITPDYKSGVTGNGRGCVTGE